MGGTFFSLSEKIVELINMGIAIVVSLSVIGLMWGIIKFLFNSTNEKARTEARSFMLYGILTLFVMTSLWGLVNILNNTLFPGYIGDVNIEGNSPGSLQERNPFDGSEDLFENRDNQLMI
jgi:hypothetical protein